MKAQVEETNTARQPVLLDLYCGAGGAAAGYARAGFRVVGVDIEDQPEYPFTFIRGDAIAYAHAHAHEYDAVHGSPPCQDSSALTAGNRKRPGWVDSHVNLIGATRVALDRAGRPYVLENVEGSQLRRDLTLCGLHFGLRVFRHRYFELGGWTIAEPLACRGRAGRGEHTGHRVAGWRHGVKYDGDMVAPYGDGGGKGTPAQWAEAMGIDWTRSKHGLREAIPPAYTAWIGARLLPVVTGAEGTPPLALVLVIHAGQLARRRRQMFLARQTSVRQVAVDRVPDAEAEPADLAAHVAAHRRVNVVFVEHDQLNGHVTGSRRSIRRVRRAAIRAVHRPRPRCGRSSRPRTGRPTAVRPGSHETAG